jgi:hypothetical protein
MRGRANDEGQRPLDTEQELHGRVAWQYAEASTQPTNSPDMMTWAQPVR